MTRALPRAAAVLVAAVLAAGSVACGSPGAGPTTALATATAPPPDSADADPDGADATTTVGRVSANAAPEDEIVEALTDAGVSDPGKWAKVVVAHRPYPTDDPTLGTLRRTLTENGAGQATDKIVAAFRP